MTTWPKKTQCPKCGHHHDCATYLGLQGYRPREPKPGDYTLCICCGSILRFTDIGLGIADLRSENISDADRRRMRYAQQIIWNRN